MNGNDLLEALGCVDDQFVDDAQSADIKPRSGKIWLRWSALAACFCLAAVLLIVQEQSPGFHAAGDNQENHLPDANLPESHGANGTRSEEMFSNSEYVMDPETADIGQVPVSYAFSAIYLRSDSIDEEAIPTEPTVIASRQQLEQYCGAREELERFDEVYFENYNLVLITVKEPSGLIRHNVIDLRINVEKDLWTITIQRDVPFESTDDPATWQILISVQMGQVIDAQDNIEVKYVTAVEEG